jgi:hypothetical protein
MQALFLQNTLLTMSLTINKSKLLQINRALLLQKALYDNARKYLILSDMFA